jgi:metallo-beta-lactamase family protein
MRMTFLGATGTVTGSKYLVEAAGARVLVDCGLFQGLKELRRRNWGPLAVDPRSLDAVVLTHAHIDHSGYVPALVRDGFSGPVFSTAATRDLSRILLPDSGHLQEEEARRANKYGYSKHTPALPLYTRADAVASLESFRAVEFDVPASVAEGVRITFSPAGHILGAASVRLEAAGQSVVFSGDLGRPEDPILRAPAPLGRTDYLVVESTYGNRRHASEDPSTLLADVIRRTAARGGAVVVPAFAVGRAQTLLYLIRRLKDARKIPDLPVVLDSPMAIDATGIFCRYLSEHRLTEDECRRMCATARYVETVEESKKISASRYPMIVISASGMATGGRILHHLKAFAPDPRNGILLVGFQAAGTRGEALASGADEIKVHGAYVPVRAEVTRIDGLSAHADADEILRWLDDVEVPPQQTFVTHGEPAAADALRRRIEERPGWRCRVPEYLERVDLG